jgi:hypothetical protein
MEKSTCQQQNGSGMLSASSALMGLLFLLIPFRALQCPAQIGDVRFDENNQLLTIIRVNKSRFRRTEYGDNR